MNDLGDLVRHSYADGVATVTMNRPERLNAMTGAMLEELLAALESAAADEHVRAVIITGAGRAFCAGGDLSDHAGLGGNESIPTAAGSLRRYMRTAQLLREMPKPTIAAVNGACAGAGLSLACSADLRYASRTSVFTTSFVNAGLSGDFGGSWTLSSIIGAGRAREAYFLSERIDADSALQMGLVSAVIPDNELLEHVRVQATRLASGPAAAIQRMKANLNEAQETSFAQALEHESVRHIETSRTADAREAASAFMEKRPPKFGQRPSR